MSVLKFLPPFIILLVFFLFIYRKPLPVYPNHKNQIYQYSDSAEGGHSQLNFFTNKDTMVRLVYTLRKGVAFPFAGMSIQLPTPYFPDLSQYDYLDVDMTTSHSRAIQLFLNVYEPGVTKENIPLSYRHVLYEVPVKKSPGIQRLWLKDFKTPVWWYPHFNLSENDLGEPHWDKVAKITFSNGVLLPLDVQETLTIRSITFGKNYFPFILWSLGGIIFYYGTFFGVIYFRKKWLNVPSKVIPYKQLETEDTGNPILQKSIAFLFENYMDPELTLSDMANKLGFSSRNISDQIKNHFNLSFKQYLNSIRLSEAKRLLNETNLPINEIAYKIGFSNTTHFNRAFRQYSDCSPQEYRIRK